MTASFGPRRALWLNVPPVAETGAPNVRAMETIDQLYRSLCSMLYNYVPQSGHPGGSISSGPIAAALVFASMDYDVSRPGAPDADVLSYAAGHKAMGLYALWALRNEVLRIAAPDMLPSDEARQLRLEDLLGFRRNPTTATPLFRRFRAKALDGHPTPATPFVRLATGASGVGLASSLGLALAALDTYGSDAPRVHVIEGEGGLTPGRVAEALAFAGTASLSNVVVHVDWNQSSIDSDHVTRENGSTGDYVQWTPMELFYLHDWNVIFVPDGMSISSVLRAQRQALEIGNHQPTAIVYRTKKGFEYGIEGRASHGAGHKLCSAGFYDSLQGSFREGNLAIPACDPGSSRCGSGRDPVIVEACFWESLGILRKLLESNDATPRDLARGLTASRERLDRRARRPRPGAPSIERLYEAAAARRAPEELVPAPGIETTLRGQLGKTLDYLNRASGGALFVASADLLGSTSVSEGAKGFTSGFFNAFANPRVAPAGRGRYLRGRDGRRPVRNLGLRPARRRRLLLRRLPRSPGAHRRATPRHRQPGQHGRAGRAVPPDDPGLRSCGTQDRGGWPHPRRSPAAAAPAG